MDGEVEHENIASNGSPERGQAARWSPSRSTGRSKRPRLGLKMTQAGQGRRIAREAGRCHPRVVSTFDVTTSPAAAHKVICSFGFAVGCSAGMYVVSRGQCKLDGSTTPPDQAREADQSTDGPGPTASPKGPHVSPATMHSALTGERELQQRNYLFLTLQAIPGELLPSKLPEGDTLQSC